jgi:hypothetical protein
LFDIVLIFSFLRVQNKIQIQIKKRDKGMAIMIQ